MILTPRRSPPCLRLGGKPAAWQSGQSPLSLMADSGKKKRARVSHGTLPFIDPEQHRSPRIPSYGVNRLAQLFHQAAAGDNRQSNERPGFIGFPCHRQPADEPCASLASWHAGSVAPGKDRPRQIIPVRPISSSLPQASIVRIPCLRSSRPAPTRRLPRNAGNPRRICHQAWFRPLRCPGPV